MAWATIRRPLTECGLLNLKRSNSKRSDSNSCSSKRSDSKRRAHILSKREDKIANESRFSHIRIYSGHLHHDAQQRMKKSGKISPHTWAIQYKGNKSVCKQCYTCFDEIPVKPLNPQELWSQWINGCLFKRHLSCCSSISSSCGTNSNKQWTNSNNLWTQRTCFFTARDSLRQNYVI